MAEPPTAGPQAAERDALLATKLYLPGPRPGLVPRPRLAAQLEAGLALGIVLVCAPAGYGKTVLTADWALAGQRPVAWLSLDPGDNDPARFWRHAVAALDGVRPGIGARVGPLAGPPAPASFEGLLTALINDLGAGPAADETLLVLDDYHVISARPVHDAVQFLLEHRPPGLRLVLTSRSDPPLALGRLRARGQLAELRAADLRFTADEAGALLRELAGGPGAALPDTAVAALAARTEGWAAGLQLAALSLRGQADAAAFVAAFRGEGPRRAGRGRAAAGLRDPLRPGRGAVAPRPARGGGAGPGAQHRRVGRPAHLRGLGPSPARPGPARPGTPGRGRPDLPAGPGRDRRARPDVTARGRHRVRGPGRGGPPAGRARRRPGTGH